MPNRPSGARAGSRRRRALLAAKFFAPAAILAMGLLMRPTPGAARPDYTRRTKQECAYCHLPGGWFLKDAGKYFEKHRSLDGYKPPEEPSKQTGDQKSTPNQNAKSK